MSSQHNYQFNIEPLLFADSARPSTSHPKATNGDVLVVVVAGLGRIAAWLLRSTSTLCLLYLAHRCRVAGTKRYYKHSSGTRIWNHQGQDVAGEENFLGEEYQLG